MSRTSGDQYDEAGSPCSDNLQNFSNPDTGDDDTVENRDGASSIPIGPLKGPTIAQPETNKGKREGETMWGYFGDTGLQGMGALELPDANATLLQNELHPIFARKNWQGDLTEACWVALLSVLCLASRFVCEESLWPFWYQLIWGREAMPEKSAAFGCPLERFDVDAEKPLDASQMQELKNFLQRYGKKDTCRFEFCHDHSMKAHAKACSVNVKRKCASKGQHTIVRIHPQYLDLLTAIGLGTLDMSQSQLLRVQFALAKTLVHELNHTIRKGCSVNRYEPCYGNHIVAEAGRAWECWLFGGAVGPAPGFNDTQGGIVLWGPWPSTWGNNPGPIWKSLPPVLGEIPEHMTVWIVGMGYIQRIQTEGFWNVDVKAGGLRVFQIPQRHGIKIWKSSSPGHPLTERVRSQRCF